MYDNFEEYQKLNDYFYKITKTIINFRNGNAKITDIIKSLGIDLLESDIEDLKEYIKNYKGEVIK